jgi:hypothetical protein
MAALARGGPSTAETRRRYAREGAQAGNPRKRLVPHPSYSHGWGVAK